MDYKIKWLGADKNFNSKRIDSDTGKVYKPEVHVIHIMQGTLLGTDSCFNDPKEKVSTHYGIGKNGEIHQYVKDEDTAWGNGYCTNPDWLWNKIYPGVNPNLYTLSYELEGNSGDVPTEDQFNALMYLLKLNSKRYNISIDLNRFVGHYVIDPVNKPFCPGTGFPWKRLFSELGKDSLITMPILKIGTKGEDVTCLQSQLKKLGYDVGIEDGDFGNKTLTALKKFQADKGLLSDGICGPVSWGKLV